MNSEIKCDKNLLFTGFGFRSLKKLDLKQYIDDVTLSSCTTIVCAMNTTFYPLTISLKTVMSNKAIIITAHGDNL